MKKWLISLTMLCLCQLTMLAQANFGTDEEYNPSSPGHPQDPSITKLYTLKTQVSPTDAGYISNGGEMQLKADTTIWLGTCRNQDYYHFLHWEQDGEVISTEEWFNYVMPAKDVVLTAVYEYNPDSPAHPDSVSFVHDLTVICTPSDAGSVNYSSQRLREGESVDLWVTVDRYHRFVGWRVNGVIVSTEISYHFVMGDHDTEVYAVFEYNPNGPGSPSANMWDEATGTVLVEEFTPGNLSDVVSNIVKGNRDAVKKVVVYGSLQSSDLSFLGNYPNCEVLDLSRTSGFSTINGYTFYFHSNLTSVVLPACVNTIEWDAFYGCSKLKEVTCLATTPPTCNNSAFSQIASGAKLYVTYKSIIEYQKAEGWKSFDIYPLPGEKALFAVNYTLDGKAWRTDSVEYRTKIALPEMEPKEGHTFSGWDNVPATMPAEDITLVASYTKNKYNLVYQLDGSEYKKTIVEYAEEITPEAEPVKVGHTFSGWSEIPLTMPAKDVTIEGSFTVNRYEIAYEIEGEVYRRDTLAYGTSITTAEAPVREGYSFSGWGGVPATMPAKNLVLSGSYSINQYTLTYMVDDVEYKKVTLDYASAITAEAEPTKEGHTFSGWSEIPATMPAKDVVITGTFTANKYAVIYTLDGEAFRTDSVTYGTAIVLAEAPAKEGHTFAGWSEVPAAMPAKDVTVTGTYTVNQYTLTYLVDGIEYKKVTLDYASAITAEAEPTKEGHTFSGWSEIPTTMPAKDVTVVGEFGVNSYQVTYMLDGKVFKTEQVKYGSPVPTPEVPAKPGYNFSGWGDVPATMPAKDLTFMGSYTINKDNKYNVIYMVDGVEFKRLQYAFQDTIVPETEPTKEGYTFSGWSEIPTTMPLHDVTVVGEFTVNMYQITYMVDGEVYATEQIAYGSAIVLKDAPAKEGYIFSGWSEAPETMPAKDIEVTGSFTVDGIDAVITSNLVDVYTLQGVMVKRQIPVETLAQELPGGIYIVNGKKMVIR